MGPLTDDWPKNGSFPKVLAYLRIAGASAGGERPRSSFLVFYQQAETIVAIWIVYLNLTLW